MWPGDWQKLRSSHQGDININDFVSVVNKADSFSSS